MLWVFQPSVSPHMHHTQQLQNDMKDVIEQCRHSPTSVELTKETSLASVSSRLVNLQTSGANLISLGEGRKKGSVRGRKRKLIRSDSSGATEFSLKQTLSNLKALYSEYSTALERRSTVSRSTERREFPDREEKEKTSVVLRKKSPRTELQGQKRYSATEKETQLKSRWEVDRRSTISSRSTVRQALKTEKLQQSEQGTFKRSHTLPGHFRGRRAPGLSVLQKAAAFSRVTEGTGLAAPFGLHIRHRSLDGRDLETKKLAASAAATARAGVREPSKTVVQTAVVRTVITKSEPAKRVSLINIDVPTAEPPTSGTPSVSSSISPSVSPIPITRVISPSSVVLPSGQEPPPRVFSPTPSPERDRSARKKSPVVTSAPASLSKATSASLAPTTKAPRRSIQNLQITGKVSHLKHLFDRQEEEEEEGPARKSRSSSPRSKGMEKHRDPEIVPKVPSEPPANKEVSILSEPLATGRLFPSPDITPKETTTAGEPEKIGEETPKCEGVKESITSLAPPRPNPPQNYSPSPEPSNPPPRPPSPIGYTLEEGSDGESSYQSYDTEYSEEEEEEEGGGEEGEGEEVDGELEAVDSATIGRRTLKTLQYVTLCAFVHLHIHK